MRRLWSAVALLPLVACAERAGAPEDLAVVFGEGGGITGRWHGHEIAADGRLSEWRGHGLDSRDEVTPVRTLDATEMQALWERIDELGVLSDPHEEYGSMSRAILLTVSGTTHTLAWPTPVEADTLTAPQRLFAYCLSLATIEAR